MASPGTYRVIPIFRSSGDVGAFLVYPYLFNREGEWIGFVTVNKEVYSILGYFVGTLTTEPRIIGKRIEQDTLSKRLNPPPPPHRLKPPSTLPLAPLLSDLPYGTIDILQEDPDRLHTSDTGDLKEDLA